MTKVLRKIAGTMKPLVKVQFGVGLVRVPQGMQITLKEEQIKVYGHFLWI